MSEIVDLPETGGPVMRILLGFRPRYVLNSETIWEIDCFMPLGLCHYGSSYALRT